MNCAQATAKALVDAGFQAAFGVSGANIEALFHALGESAGMRLRLAKHEANAVTMAEGYFRRHGHPGLVLTTSGGGAFHTLAPLAEALASQIPTLVIVGQIPSEQEGRGGFQDSSGLGTRVDAETIFASVSVAVRKIRSAEALPQALQKLLTAAIQDRGPAVLLVPREVWQQLAPAFSLHIPTGILPMPDVEALRQAEQQIQSASRILVVAGKDVLFHQYADALRDFVRRTAAWIAVTADGKGLWDHEAPEFVGVIGVMGHSSAETAWEQADLIVIIGSTLPVMSRPLRASVTGKAILHLHSRSRLSLESSVLSLIGAVNPTLQLLTPPQQRTFHNPPEHPALLPSSFRTDKIAMLDAVSRLSQAFPESPVFVDAGNVGAAAIHGFWPRGGAIFSVALGMGGMGHSFGCAIGATDENSLRTLVIAGDGSFYMYGLEIHSAWEYQLPVTFVIFNNNAHAMCRIREELYVGAPGPHNVFRPSQLGAGMRAMLPGLPAFDVSDLAQLEEILQATRDVRGPVFIAIETDPLEPPPFLPFRRKS